MIKKQMKPIEILKKTLVKNIDEMNVDMTELFCALAFIIIYIFKKN